MLLPRDTLCALGGIFNELRTEEVNVNDKAHCCSLFTHLEAAHIFFILIYLLEKCHAIFSDH